MSEKTKNQSAILTVLTLFTIAIVWFPVLGVIYLITIALVAISTDQVEILFLICAPILATYFLFLALLEYKKVTEYIKARYKEIKHNLF